MPEKNERTHVRCYLINQRRKGFPISRTANVSVKGLPLAAFLCQCADRLIYVFGTLKDLKMEYPRPDKARLKELQSLKELLAK